MDDRNATPELNKDPESYTQECKEWCEKQGLDFSDVGSRLGFFISKDVYMDDDDLNDDFYQDFLPNHSESEDAWRPLVEWRHPQVNLNLLQLALVFKAHYLIHCLWHPLFLREEDYRDESSRLVNHPLHLSFKMNPRRFVEMHHIREELFYEEGLVDLTAPRIQKGFYTAKPDCCFHVNVPLYDIWGIDVPSGVPSANSEPIRLAPLLLEKNLLSTYDLALSAVQKMAGTWARPSTVELVRDLATDTTWVGTLRGGYFTPVLQWLPPAFKEEILILLCQCTWTVPQASRAHFFQDEGVPDFYNAFLENEDVHFEKAARFLSKDLVKRGIDLMELYERFVGFGDLPTPSPLPSEVLKDTIANRNLQDLCVLAVMEAVRGDARKVWSLDQLPMPLKEKFHLPFQTVYEELKEKSQG